MPSNETIATFQHDGKTFEIDHLGVGAGEFDQWGEFAVCEDHGDGGATQVAEFAIPESILKPEFRPDELPPVADLIERAKRAVGGDSPDPLPAELSEAINSIVHGEG